MPRFNQKRRHHAGLLADGLHKMTLDKLEYACCGHKFTTSQNRIKIMRGLREFVSHLEQAGFSGEVWVNGSFMTDKFQPEDADVVFRVHASAVDIATDEQKAIIERLASRKNRELIFECHTQVWELCPEGHPRHYHSSTLDPYWQNQFGKTGGGDGTKGIAVLQIGGGL